MTVSFDRPSSVVSTNLVLHLDAGNTTSYPGTGTVWYDLSPTGANFNIVATAYNSSGPKYMDFNGSYGCAKRSPDTTYYNSDMTAIVWTRVKNSTAEWRTLFRALSTGSDHNIIAESGAWRIGVYDGSGGTAFNASDFLQTSLPNYGTSNWCMLTFRWNNSTSPYLNISYDDTPQITRGHVPTSGARFKNGICSIGAYNNGTTTPSDSSQPWGDIGVVMMYNRYLSDDEVLQNYNYYATRFGKTQRESVIFSDNSRQASAISQVDTGSMISVMSYGSSGTYTYTVPIGSTKLHVKVQGGGGGGAGYCESGGAGGFSEKLITGLAPGSTVTVTVGGGGATVTYYAAGGQGGTSSFGSYCSATGGYGANQNYSHTGGGGGTGSGGNVNLQGGGGTGHANHHGHGAVGKGGASYFGGQSGIRHDATTGGVIGGGSPGAGGAGARTNDGTSGAAGLTGLVTVYAYA